MSTERLGRAVLEFVTDNGKFSSELDKIEKKTGGLNKTFENASRGLQGFGSSATKIGGLLSTAVTLPLIAAGAAGIKFSTELNESMANVATLIPKSTARVQELKASVQEMAIATGQSTKDLSEGLYQVISAFGDTADTSKILEINARAAAAGLATTTDAINLTSAVTKAYGDTSAAAVQQVSDLSLLTVRLGQTTFPELAASMGRVTPLAAGLGVSMQELFGVMATGTGVTGGAAEVSTQLRGVLQSLMAPTADMTALFEKLGVTSGKALLEQKGLQGSIDLIVQAAEKSGVPLQKFISSIEGQTLAMALAGPQAETFTQKLKAMEGAAGTTEVAFREQAEGINKLGFTWKQLRAQFEVLAQRLGDALAPALSSIAGLITQLLPLFDGVLKAFTGLPSGIQVTIIAIAGLAAAAGPAIYLMGQLAVSVGALSKVMKEAAAAQALSSRLGVLGGAMRGLGAVLAGPAGLIALLGAGAAAFTLYKTSQAQQQADKFLKEAQDMKAASKLVGEVIANVGEARAALAAFEAGKAGTKLQDMASATTAVAKAWQLGAESAKKLGDSSAISSEQIGASSLTIKGFGKAVEEAVAPTDKLRLTKERLAAADAKYNEEINKNRAGLELAIRGMDRLGDDTKKVATDFQISEQSVARFKRELESGTKAGEKHADTLKDIAAAHVLLTPKQIAYIDREIAAGNTVDNVAKALKISEVAVKNYTEAKERGIRASEEFAELEKEIAIQAQAVGKVLRQQGVDMMNASAASMENALRVSMNYEEKNRQLHMAGRELEIRQIKLAEKAALDSLGIRTAANGRWHDEATAQIKAFYGHQVDLAQGSTQTLTELAKKQWATHKEQLQRAQDEAVAYYNVIAADATATAKEVTEAFNAMNAAIVANGGKAVVSWKERLKELGTAVKEIAYQAGNAFAGLLAEGIKTGDWSQFENQFKAILSEAMGAGMAAAINFLTQSKLGTMLQPLLTALSDKLLGALGLGTRGRDLVKEFAATFEGGFEGLRQKLSALGAEGDLLWRRLTQGVGRDNPKQAQAAIDAITAALGRAEQKTAAFNSALGGLLGRIRDLGTGLPNVLRDYLSELERGGRLTQENIDLLHELAGEGETDWRKIQEAVQRYGGDISKLGGTFQAQRLHDSWQQIIDDVALFEAGGMSAVDILNLTKGKINEVVGESIRFGTEIPANMRPWIEKLIESGELVDDNGQKITDIGKLKFGETLQTSLQNLTDEIKKLIDAFKGIPKEAGAAARGIEREIGSVRVPPIKVSIQYDDPGYTPTVRSPDLAASGGLVTPHGIQRFGFGGIMRSIFGEPRGTDTRPAWLTPGEGVLNLKAMDIIGPETLHALNAGRVPEASSTSTGTVSSTKPVVNVAVNVDATNSYFDSRDRVDQVAKSVAKAIERGGDVLDAWARHAVPHLIPSEV